ncbi:MAG: DUF2202 domain-containing protein, partial [Planctomycetes bacterium]|nr:DUF2202 domain-containing protein [Planctomycetota bacterium]
KLARDVYLEIYNTWGLSIFKGTAEEEKEHMEVILGLLNRYGLADPAQGPGTYLNADLYRLHKSLVAQGVRSKSEGLKACALQEEINILDLDGLMSQASRPDIAKAYREIQRDSFNHLRSFAQALEVLGQRYQGVRLPQQTIDAIVLEKMDRGFMLR